MVEFDYAKYLSRGEIRKRQIKSNLRNLKKPYNLIMFIFLSLICISYIYAFCWGFLNSVKSVNDFAENIWGFPKKWHFDNYAMVYSKLYYTLWATQRKVYFPELLWNSFLYSTFPVIIYNMCLAMAAYVCCKYRFWFNKVIMFIVMFVIVWPNPSTLSQNLEFLRRWGLYDNYWAYLEGMFVFADYNFIVYTGIFQNISTELIEAAKIDGAGNYQIMWTIVFPLARVVFLILMLTGFIGAWNSYEAVLTTMPSMPNLPLCLYYFKNNTITEIAWPMYQIAASLMIALPCVVLYCIFEPWMVGNLTAGAIKG